MSFYEKRKKEDLTVNDFIYSIQNFLLTIKDKEDNLVFIKDEDYKYIINRYFDDLPGMIEDRGDIIKLRNLVKKNCKVELLDVEIALIWGKVSSDLDASWLIPSFDSRGEKVDLERIIDFVDEYYPLATMGNYKITI